MRRCVRSSTVLFVTGLAVLAPALASSAGQDSPAPPPKSAAAPAGSPRRTGWVFEAHVGSIPDKGPGNVGLQAMPQQGPKTTTPEGNSSRQVPSWYFGDGAALANSVADKLGGIPHIMPLDPVLTAAATTRRSGVDFGLRIGHTITGRVLLLFSFDQVPARLPLTSSAQAAITATNASFKPYWDAWLAGVGNTTTNSTLTITSTDGSEKMASVAAEVRIATIQGWTPYVTFGAGVAVPLPAVETRVTLLGHYETTVIAPGIAANGAHPSETDQLQVRYEVVPAGIGIFGVGVEHDLQRHVGVRAELRSFLNANKVRTRIDARPISGPTAPPVVDLRAGVNPDIQVSTNPNRTTSLSLQGVDHFYSFQAKGSLLTFSIGVFFRF